MPALSWNDLSVREASQKTQDWNLNQLGITCDTGSAVRIGIFEFGFPDGEVLELSCRENWREKFREFYNRHHIKETEQNSHAFSVASMILAPFDHIPEPERPLITVFVGRADFPLKSMTDGYQYFDLISLSIGTGHSVRADTYLFEQLHEIAKKTKLVLVATRNNFELIDDGWKTLPKNVRLVISKDPAGLPAPCGLMMSFRDLYKEKKTFPRFLQTWGWNLTIPTIDGQKCMNSGNSFATPLQAASLAQEVVKGEKADTFLKKRMIPYKIRFEQTDQRGWHFVCTLGEDHGPERTLNRTSLWTNILPDVKIPEKWLEMEQDPCQAGSVFLNTAEVVKSGKAALPIIKNILMSIFKKIKRTKKWNRVKCSGMCEIGDETWPELGQLSVLCRNPQEEIERLIKDVSHASKQLTHYLSEYFSQASKGEETLHNIKSCCALLQKEKAICSLISKFPKTQAELNAFASSWKKMCTELSEKVKNWKVNQRYIVGKKLNHGVIVPLLCMPDSHLENMRIIEGKLEFEKTEEQESCSDAQLEKLVEGIDQFLIALTLREGYAKLSNILSEWNETENERENERDAECFAREVSSYATLAELMLLPIRGELKTDESP